PSGNSNRYTMRSDSLVLVTLIEAVCADGSPVPPTFILPNSDTGEWWDDTRVGVVATLQTGWLDDNLCTHWFQKVFIPYAHSRNPSGGPILLI
ncbi:hypothetical protein K439DRAFT_1256777, partial [Ramaria rubella]